MLDYLLAVLYGIVEGITEWLPISSTGHLIITQGLLSFSNNLSADFPKMFNYVIQLGAIFAVIFIFWNKLWPFKMPEKGAKILSKDKGIFKCEQWTLWFKVVVATLPSAAALLVDSLIESIVYTEDGTPTTLGIFVISIALVFYGVAFVIVEKFNNNRKVLIKDTTEITYKTALLIGLFQVLAIVPGTSRSGATIIGALIIGVSRTAASEFSFFMAIPTMFGVSFLKILQYLVDNTFKFDELLIIGVGMVVSFVVSMLCIKKLMQYVQKHTFAFFGYYRIILGIIVLLYFIIVR